MNETIVEQDVTDRHPWETIRSEFLNGVLTYQMTVLDDGVVRETEFSAGIRSRMLQQDLSADGSARRWEQIESFYAPDGVIEARLTVFDNGVVKEELFSGGVRQQIVQRDAPDGETTGGVKPWTEIASYYDAGGQLEARYTVYDNGVVREETFQGGVRAHTRMIDNPELGGNGAKSWDVIDTFYDATGTIEAKMVLLDNGIVREELYSNGIRSKITQYDNPYGPEGDAGAKSWKFIESYFDANGQIEARFVEYDDGRIRQDSYTDGALVSSEIQDNAFTSGTGAHPWTAINLYYDENGKVAHKFTTYDDGRVAQTDYIDGVRVQTTIEDRAIIGNGNYDWDTLYFHYDAAGDLAGKGRMDDDGDATFTVIENGVAVQKLEYDGDNSEAWAGRLTTYAPDGSVAEVETFASAEDMPVHDFSVPGDLGLNYVLG